MNIIVFFYILHKGITHRASFHDTLSLLNPTPHKTYLLCVLKNVFRKILTDVTLFLANKINENIKLKNSVQKNDFSSSCGKSF